MPGGDRTGPFGGGAMTGRGVGYCVGNDVPGYMVPGPGRGMGWGWGGGGRGRGMGRGRGWRHQYYATGLYGWQRGAGSGFVGRRAGPPYAAGADFPGRKAELSGLREQAEHYRRALEEIERRIEQLEEGRRRQESDEG